MNVQLNSISDTRKNLVVTLDQGEVAAERKAVVGEFSKQARLPGFRPGKAPVAMIERRFGKEIADELQQKVVAKAYREGLEKQKLEVLSVVKVEPGTIAVGAEATITVTVDVRPEFELPAYTGLPTQVAPVEVSEAEVAAAIEAMRSERADFKVTNREARKGDYVKLAYEGKVDGQPVAELVPDKQIYGKVPQTWEEVEGEHEGIIPGLGKQLGGLKTGDKKDVTVAFPADFSAAPALAGKTATYAVEVQEIRERVLPEIDDEFLKSHQADSLDALKTSVSNNLKFQKEGRNRAEQRRQVTDALLEKLSFDAPESLVESETQSFLRQFIEQNMRRGVPQEQFEKDKQALVENARKAAVGRVKLQLALAKIAEAEKLTVEENDINNFIYREAMRSGQQPDKFVKELGKNRDALRGIQQNIIFDKAVDLLVAKATVGTIESKA